MRLIKIFFVLSVILGGASCNDFLKVEPENAQSPEGFVENEARLLNLVDNAYVLTRRAFVDNMNWAFYSEVRAGHFEARNGWFQPFKNQNLMFNGYAFAGRYPFDVLRNWNRYYEAIVHCNFVLDKIESYNGAPVDQAYLNEYKGQILFLRALNYFQIIRTWGPAMWVDKFDDSSPRERVPIATVADNILTDLEFSAANLPVIYKSRVSGAENKTITKIRASKGAALILMMNIQATIGNYEQVVSLYEAIINNEGNGDDQYFYLLDGYNNYNRIFDGNSDEVVFYFHLIQDSDYEIDPGHLFGEINIDNKDYFLLEIPSADHLKAFYDHAGNTFLDDRVEKFFNISSLDERIAFRKSNSSKMIFRWADVVTLAAEAYYKTSNSVKAIELTNSIRERAGLSLIDEAVSEPDLWEAIMLERERELFGEGWFFYDLIRWNRVHELENITLAEAQAGKIYWPLAAECFIENPELTQTSFWK